MTNHVDTIYQQTLQDVHAAIENMRIETQKTAESFRTHALNAKHAEAREVFDRHHAEALEMQQLVAKLEDSAKTVAKRNRTWMMIWQPAEMNRKI